LVRRGFAGCGRLAGSLVVHWAAGGRRSIGRVHERIGHREHDREYQRQHEREYEYGGAAQFGGSVAYAVDAKRFAHGRTAAAGSGAPAGSAECGKWRSTVGLASAADQ
jgi:hypothetical protein